MASSGLFTLQEFKNRGIIKLAPDVLVYISGALGDRIIAPVAGEQSFDFSDGITSVNISNTIENPGQSTASIQITTPIYGERSNYWITIYDPDMKKTRRIPYFIPMMEVRIYMKGRFLSGGTPKYYPVFWGLINSVEENFSGGLYTMSVNCVDMLHWWQWSTVNIHPVPETNVSTGGNLDLTVWGTIFKTGNPYVIMHRLFEIGGEYLFTPPTWLGQRTPLSQSYPSETIQTVSRRIMDYWGKRLKNLGSVLKMYGVMGREITVVPGKGNRHQLIELSPLSNKILASTASKAQAAGQDMGTKIWGYDANFLSNMYLSNFTVFAELDKMGSFEQSEYMTKLEIATQVKERCEFEFFQDVNGCFIFKPPFYNMNVKYTMPYVIKPKDIISNSYQIDSEGIITTLQVRLPLSYATRDAKFPGSFGYHIDIDLAGKYGVRHKMMDANWIATPQAANQLAVGYMALNNAKCMTGTLTIPGRPELRMGYPIYVEHRDSFHYVKGINHTFDYGGSFTTILSLEAERMKQYKEDGSVYRDTIWLYTGPSGDTSSTPVSWSKLPDDLAATKTFGLQQGRYDLVSRQKALSLRSSDTNLSSQKAESMKAVTNFSVPFTDEEGYRVIGGFQYGRGLPYIFERNMVIVDDAAGYEEESFLMNKLHTQQNRPFVASAKTSGAAPTSDGGTTVPEGTGENVSTRQYEGIILAYLDNGKIDGGLDSPTTKEREEAKANTNDAVTNPVVDPKTTPSEKTLAGQTPENQVIWNTQIANIGQPWLEPPAPPYTIYRTL